MGDSTEGVTLFSGFLLALLAQYEDLRSATCAPLFAMAKGLDPSDPTKPVPMSLYNEMCTWIEDNLGQANLRRSGRAIGQSAYDQMVRDGRLGDAPTPQSILGELKRVASAMIQDPRGRGWEIPEAKAGRVLMRRTQSFNCVLQEGLLLSLVERTGVARPQVDHVRCTRSGAEFCEYAVTWAA